jgi:adenosylcobinamide-phosphate synthase
MGVLIESYTKFFWKKLPNQRAVVDFGAGAVLALGLVTGTIALTQAIVAAGRSLHPSLGFSLETGIIASCLANRSLTDAARSVLAVIDDLPTARQVLSQYVGRDTASLNQIGIYRAVLETVTENSTDAVMAPLLYAMVGNFWGMGASLAMGYKALSTLDSMVGYRQQPYTYLGRFSARWEDVMTWLPCRCHVLTLIILSGKPRAVWRICRRDAPQDPSPNSGWSECVYAAILGVRLGGINTYRGIAKAKPFLGDDRQPITTATIHAALALTNRAILVWLAIYTVLQLWLQEVNTSQAAW